MNDHPLGFAMIPNWIVWDTSIGQYAKLVYVCLTSHASRKGNAWPSHALIAKEAGISVTSVKQGLAELKALGVVSWEPRTNPETGGRSSNSYTVLITPPSSQPSAP